MVQPFIDSFRLFLVRFLVRFLSLTKVQGRHPKSWNTQRTPHESNPSTNSPWRLYSSSYFSNFKAGQITVHPPGLICTKRNKLVRILKAEFDLEREIRKER